MSPSSTAAGLPTSYGAQVLDHLGTGAVVQPPTLAHVDRRHSPSIVAAIFNARAATHPVFPRHVVDTGKHSAGATPDERLGVVAGTHVKRHRRGDLLRLGPRQTGERACSVQNTPVVLPAPRLNFGPLPLVS